MYRNIKQIKTQTKQLTRANTRNKMQKLVNIWTKDIGNMKIKVKTNKNKSDKSKVQAGYPTKQGNKL